MNSIRNLSLAVTVPSALFLAIICLQTLVFTFQYQQAQQQLYSEKEQHIKGIAGNLQTNLSYALMRLEKAQAQNIISEAALDYNLMRIAVVDHNQQIVLSNQLRDKYMFAQLQLPHYDGALLNQVIEKNDFIFEYNERAQDLLVYVPLQMLSKGNTLNRKFNGLIYIRYSLSHAITELRYETLFSLIKVTLTLLICLLIFIYAIKRFFINPLNQLAQTMSVSDLNANTEEQQVAYGELGDLQRAFIGFTKRINQRLNTLSAREQRLLYAVNGARDGVWDWDIEKNSVYFSQRWQEMLGYQQGEFESSIEEWEALIHKDDLNSTIKALQLHFSGKNSFFESTYRIRCHNGSYCWILSRGQTVSWGSDGEPLRIVGTHTEISHFQKTNNVKVVEAVL
ncbi:hypothetical protein GCM10007916_23430 [Psychromonas marina]|uniref:histidine kinase n=1 Tax=Psychromonas marina TaxID=88364 RepID=A0ABQ6E1K7_9GAMM|nr:PAS domain-containing protein [Psychromonas marina]GLS91274.1 hypothetical protein GCM10007916_23430 [Psychromonas marina]